MSEVKVNKVTPRSGTTLTIGDSGDTTNVVGTLQNNGAALVGDISSVVAGTNLSGGGTSGAVTINLADASTSAKGAASFSSDNFAASSGAVTIKDLGIATAELQDDSVTYAKMQDTGTANRVLGAASAGTIGEVQVVADMVADNAITLAKMASGTDGNIISYDASGNPVAIATGSDGQVLTSAGAGAQPAFEALPSSGKILQVLQNLEGNTRSTTVTSFQNIAGIEQAITPSASNSKVLVSSVLVLSCGNHGVVRFIRVTGGTTTVIGAGTTASGQKQNGSMTSNSDGNTARPQPFQFLDSPSTTSAVTYYAQWIANSSTPVYLNRTPNDANEIYGSRFSSTITLMEVGA